MANHKSAIKANKQQEKRRMVNRKRFGSIKRAEKDLLQAIESGDRKAAKAGLSKAQSCAAKGVSQGIVHKNKLARKVAKWCELVASVK